MKKCTSRLEGNYEVSNCTDMNRVSNNKHCKYQLVILSSFGQTNQLTLFLSCLSSCLQLLLDVRDPHEKFLMDKITDGLKQQVTEIAAEYVANCDFRRSKTAKKINLSLQWGSDIQIAETSKKLNFTSPVFRLSFIQTHSSCDLLYN